MVDQEYNGINNPSRDFIILEKKVEYELKKMGYSGSLQRSSDPDLVYDFIFDKIQSDRKSVHRSPMGKVFDKSIRKIGVTPDAIWKNV